MRNAEVPDYQRVNDRLTRLEEMLMHMQRTLEDLDAAVLQFGNRLQAAEEEIALLRAVIDRTSRLAEEPRCLEDDRPPHY